MYSACEILSSCSLFGAFIVLVIFASVQTSYEQLVQSSPTLFPHDSKPFNVTMGKWFERYWNWAASIPRDVHPRGDITGKNCGTNQNGPVWFLDPPIELAKAEQPIFHCEIPEGKAIFVPLIVGECDGTVPTLPKNATDKDFYICASSGNNQGAIRFSIDGKPLLETKKTSPSPEDYSLYRTTSDFFNISFVDKNIFTDIASGPWRALADGYFSIVQPLSLGDHKMFIQNTVLQESPDRNPETHTLLIGYNIKIVKNQNSSS
jgi:hypothetical protein